ncbi:MAG TPA: pyrroline-5-carboxylate reductase [Novosphingobium sp.]|nr:pyrroline-5-carboxylate reductase [Novosphingobium sp.]
MAWPRSLLIVGCGNMGGAMLAGWLAGGLDPARVTIFDPNLAAAPTGTTLLRELAGGRFDMVLLGVKPQLLGEVAPALVAPETILISILAGVELASLAERFPAAKAIVRVMPSLAAAIGKSPVALAARGLDEAGRTAVTALMEPLGMPQWLDEAQFDLITALVGSGPAFVYRFIDALAAGATTLGLEAGPAQQFALAMVEGAAILAATSDHTPDELAARVASPGGTTRAGLDVLDADGALARLVEQTLRRARDRGTELAEAARTGG